MILNPAVNKVIKFFITTLYAISPKTYEKNLTNYNKIQILFGISPQENTPNTGENLKSMMDDIMFQVKK
ncbi:MAG: hypothetical protein WCL02_03740 [bacterium]